MTSTIHVSDVGTYHPAPKDDIAWTVNDTRGYMDGGPACDKCGACDCGLCDERKNPGPWCSHHHEDDDDRENPCVGLSFAYICLDGGEALCEDCFKKDDSVNVVDCDCE